MAYNAPTRKEARAYCKGLPRTEVGKAINKVLVAYVQYRVVKLDIVPSGEELQSIIERGVTARIAKFTRKIEKIILDEAQLLKAKP